MMEPFTKKNEEQEIFANDECMIYKDSNVTGVFVKNDNYNELQLIKQLSPTIQQEVIGAFLGKSQASVSKKKSSINSK